MRGAAAAEGATVTANHGLPPGLPTPPDLVRDLGEFRDPSGRVTRQWIIAGADTASSLRWLRDEMQALGWTLAAPHLLVFEDLIVQAHATTYPRGIGFDEVHNLRLTLVDLRPPRIATSGPGARRRHLHRRTERRAHR